MFLFLFFKFEYIKSNGPRDHDLNNLVNLSISIFFSRNDQKQILFFDEAPSIIGKERFMMFLFYHPYQILYTTWPVFNFASSLRFTLTQ